MFSDPTFWVAAAFFVLLALVSKPLVRAAVAGLDARAARIRKEIEEAETLREEAHRMLADYKRRLRDAAKEATALVEHAKVEAERLREQAAADLEASLKRREQAAREKIAQAEDSAIKEIRHRAVDLAVAATARLVAEGLDQGQGKTLLSKAIGELPGKLH